MPNHRRTPIETIGTWNDVTLHDITNITTLEEYTITRQHALREDADFEPLNYRVYRLHDATSELDQHLDDTEVLHHVVFDAAYRPVDSISDNGTGPLEHSYRESLFSLIVDRVVFKYIDPKYVYLATVVCGDNITTSGEVYDMQPALHLIVDDAVSDDDIMAMIAGLYDYMAVHGYIIDGESSNFLINLN